MAGSDPSVPADPAADPSGGAHAAEAEAQRLDALAAQQAQGALIVALARLSAGQNPAAMRTNLQNIINASGLDQAAAKKSNELIAKAFPGA